MAAFGDGHTSGCSDQIAIIAHGGLEVCDGAHRWFVTKKIRGPAQAKLGRATLYNRVGVVKRHVDQRRVLVFPFVEGFSGFSFPSNRPARGGGGGGGVLQPRRSRQKTRRGQWLGSGSIDRMRQRAFRRGSSGRLQIRCKNHFGPHISCRFRGCRKNGASRCTGRRPRGKRRRSFRNRCRRRRNWPVDAISPP